MPSIHPFQVVLPSTSSIAEFWPESQHFVALPHELQKTVSSHLGATYIGLNILLALINGNQKKPGQRNDSTALERHEPWVLDTCLALWQQFRRWTTGADRKTFHDESVSSFLHLLDAILLPQNIPKACLTESAKAAQFFACGISSLLDKPKFSVMNQLQLASLLIRVRTALYSQSQLAPKTVRRRASSIATIASDTEASIERFCQDADKFSSLHNDLQVCMVR